MSSNAPPRPDSPAPDRIGPGRVILIVGPSGSGKDTLLRLARTDLARTERVSTDPARPAPAILFPARLVTRASSAPEEEAATTRDAFAAAETDGAFALAWHAHGLCYAIPATIDSDVRAGRTVVLNASRTVIAAARRRYTDVAVVLIDAPAEVRAARLAERGREDPANVAERLTRSPPEFTSADADLVIDNTGEPHVGATRLTRFIAGS